MPTKEKESSIESFDGQFVGITLAEDSLKPWEMETVNAFPIEQKGYQSSCVNSTGLYTWEWQENLNIDVVIPQACVCTVFLLLYKGFQIPVNIRIAWIKNANCSSLGLKMLILQK